MIAQLDKRYPALTFCIAWLMCAVAGFALPKSSTIVDFVDKWLSDLRLTTIGRTMPTRADMVVLTITEDTLANHPYRFPIDRGMLADAIDRINAAGSRAIGIDVLFDQPTESRKDRRLAEAVSRSVAPVVVGWASKVDGLTDKQVAFLREYLPEAVKAPSNLTKDGRDGTVRWIYPGTRDGDRYRPGFASALAESVGGKKIESTTNLYYRRGDDGAVQPFRKFPLHLLEHLPKDWLTGKIVLIGADLPNEDRHRTPFSAPLGSDDGALPGVVIHGYALAQILDRVNFSSSGVVVDALIVMAAAGLGICIALLNFGVLARLTIFGATLMASWVGGFGLFAAAGVMIPLFSPSLTMAAALAVGAAILGQRYKQKKQYAEAMVRRRNQSLHKLVENSFDGIIITTSGGDIVSTNASADLIMGWDRHDAVGRGISEFIPEIEDIDACFMDIAFSRSATSTTLVEPKEVACKRADSTPFTMELLVYTAGIAFEEMNASATAGERVSYIYSFRDVTARKLTEEARENARKEAESANRAKTEFLATMSHELRTPLNAIIGFSEIMKTEALGPVGTPQYKSYLEDIHKSGGHLLAVINDILDMSRIEAGDMKLQEEPVDLGRIVRASVRLVADRAEAAGVTLETDVPADLLSLLGDERMLKQVLMNLLSNAVKFTPMDGQVTVRVETRADGGLSLAVSDTGIGIAPEHMELVLRPFGQVDSRLERSYEGTGLGLPLVKAMIELHDGTLRIESTTGEGTTVTAYFPADRAVKKNERILVA